MIVGNRGIEFIYLIEFVLSILIIFYCFGDFFCIVGGSGWGIFRVYFFRIFCLNEIVCYVG